MLGPGCDRGKQKIDKTRLPGPDLAVVATSPTAEQTDVALDTPVRVRFSRFLDPASVIRQSVRVTGGTINPDGTPAAGEEFLEPTYDVLERVVIYRLSGGRRWTPGVRFTITLWSPSEHEGGGFRAWDGAPLTASQTFSFSTTSDTNPVTTEPALPPAVFCSTCVSNNVLLGGGSVAVQRCGTANCHNPEPANAPGEGPANGLDLSSFEAMTRTALDLPAHQALTGPTSQPEVLPGRFGSSMPLISKGQPGNSYALYKLLVPSLIDGTTIWDLPGKDNPNNLPAQPVGGDIRPPQDELDRLRNAFVVGDRMPLNLRSFTLPQARALQAWIAAGAPGPSDSCPDVDTCNGAAGSAGAGGAGGSGGAGGDSGAGGSGGFKSFAGCTFDTAVSAATTTIKGLSYDPPCLKVKVGTEVTLPGVSGHPLKGMVDNGDQPNPLAAGQPGAGYMTDLKVTLSTPGSFGFYCIFHGGDLPDNAGMAGVVYVEP